MELKTGCIIRSGIAGIIIRKKGWQVDIMFENFVEFCG